MIDGLGEIERVEGAFDGEEVVAADLCVLGGVAEKIGELARSDSAYISGGIRGEVMGTFQ